MEVGYQLHARTDDVSGHIYRPTEHTGTCNVRELSGLADLASLPGARLEAAAGCSGGGGAARGQAESSKRESEDDVGTVRDNSGLFETVRDCLMVTLRVS